MKKNLLNLILCLPSLLFLTGIVDPDTSNTEIFETEFDMIGPYEANCENKTLKGTIKSKYAYSSIRERLSVGNSHDNYIDFQSKAKHSITTASYDITFILPTKLYLNETGLCAKFSIVDSNSVTLYSFSFTLYPKHSSTINPKEYINSAYVISNTIIKPGSRLQLMSEYFLFSDMLDYFNVDSYYRLSFNDIAFRYLSIASLTYQNIYLEYEDFDNIFPYLSTYVNGVNKVKIPLSANLVFGKICLSFPSIMYVNPRTLEMSLKSKIGFVSTHYFYLPINKRTLLLDQNFTLIFDRFGPDETSFKWTVKYMTDRSLIGDCDNSDYCVIGEENND